MNYSSKIYINFEKFFSFLVLLLPLTLISGPAVPNIFRILIALFFFFIFLKDKKFYLFKNLYVLLFGFFCIYISLRSLFLLVDEDSAYGDFLFSIQSSLFYFSYLFYAFGIAYLLNTFDKLKLYLVIIIFSVSAFLFIDTTVQFFFGHNIFNMYVDNQVGRLSSLFGKELILGSFIQKILPIGILMSYFLFNKKIFSKLFILFAAIGTVTIVLSGERAAFILWLFFIFLSLFILKFNLKYKSIVFFFIIIFFISSVFFNKSIKDRFIYQFQEQIEFRENQKIKFFSRGHSRHIESSIKMFLDNVFFGQGPNMFRIKCSNPKFFVKDACTTHPHNIYFQLLAEIGLIGFFIIFITFVYLTILYIKIIFTGSAYKNFSNKFIITLIPFYISFWPLVTTGSFFNSWVNNIHFLCLGISLSYLQKREIGKIL
jgi:O-antigen ligase